MRNPISTGVNVADIEDAILQGQEDAVEILRDVIIEYFGPMMQMGAAMRQPAQPPMMKGQAPYANL